ncbi:hypothetical protein LMT19_000873 [Listeria monocytogenes]|nr:hypothetical protein [Listeria monocytogenes]EIM2449675.1 hypothetical protein [Listeria monocytogenes]EKZ3816366.1 hypothetical protein [Listeria monocytogenes]
MAKLETFYPIVATPKRAYDRNFPGNNLVVPDLCNATKCRKYTMKNEHALLK